MVASVSNQSSLRLQNMLRGANVQKMNGPTVKAGVGVKTPKIDAGQAEELIKEFLNLSPQQKVEARPILTNLFKNDQFSLDEGARTKFAHALGVDKSHITPVNTARLGGTAPQTNVRELAMDMLKQIPKFDGKRMKNFLEGAKEMMPKEGQEFLAAALGGMSKEGSIKMDPKARKDFVKWTGSLNQKGGVTEHKAVMEAPRSEATSALSKAMAGAQTFEQLVAAFMMFIVGDLQEKTTDKMKEVDGAQQRDAASGRVAKASEFAGGSLNSIPVSQRPEFTRQVAEKLGVDVATLSQDLAPHFAGAGAAASSTVAQKPSISQQVGDAAKDIAAQFGFGSVENVPPKEREPFMKMVADKTKLPLETVHKEFGIGNSATTPSAVAANKIGGAAKVPMGPQAFKSYVSDTQKTLQAALQSTHAQFNDVEKRGAFAGKTGIITGFEAEKIASKLEGLLPPVSAVIANSMMNGLLNSSVDLDGPAKPIADWAAKQLGGWDNVDLNQVMEGHPISKGSGKLEQDIAGFIVGALEESGKTMKLSPESAPSELQEGIDALKDKMGVLKSFANQMEQNPVAKQAFDELKGNTVNPKTGELSAPAIETSEQMKEGVTMASEISAPKEGSALANANPVSKKSTALLFEDLKNLQQEMMQIMQALSNVLNMMKENAMNAIRSIR